LTDKWLRFGNPWEIVCSEITFDVKLGDSDEVWFNPSIYAPSCRCPIIRPTRIGFRVQKLQVILITLEQVLCCLAHALRKSTSRT
jgi:hypothetical protein